MALPSCFLVFMSGRRSQRPGAFTHTIITWTLLPTAPQVPDVTPGSPLCPWCFKHSSWRGARQKPIHIQLEDDHPIFWRPNRLSIPKRMGVQARCQELLAARLIELSNGKYACATVMPLKKDIFGNWMKKRMCGNYRLVNRKTKSEWYPMPIPEELVDAIGFCRVFSTWT